MHCLQSIAQSGRRRIAVSVKILAAKKKLHPTVRQCAFRELNGKKTLPQILIAAVIQGSWRGKKCNHTIWLIRHLFFFFLAGLPFRLVLAILRSSALLIDSYMPLDAPLREDFLPLPLFAANAAPAAICCFFDFAGIQSNLQALDFFSEIFFRFPKSLLKTSK
jgi:hypothetical protein